MKLKSFRADKSKIENIDALAKLPSLQRIYVDQTGVQDFTMRDFIKKNNKTLVIYKTIHLNRWWSSLSTNWKDAFRTQMGSDTTATRENLHKLVEMSSLKIKDSQIGDLSALNEFVALKELHLLGSSVTDIPAMENLMFLTSLHITKSPLQQLKNIASIKTLEDLDISNTPVDDLKDLGSLENVKSFNCSGTQVKRLDVLGSWSSLESLDCSNSRVTNLDALLPLPLKTLKIYNTKVSERQVQNFKKAKPDCDVVYYR